jgi:hypothetical protein
MPSRLRQELSYGRVSIGADRDPTSEASFFVVIRFARRSLGYGPRANQISVLSAIAAIETRYGVRV